MPVSLPKREGSVESFRFDSPLTNIGAFEAKLIGESFAQANVNIRYAYSSPALRCVQTCHNVFRGKDDQVIREYSRNTTKTFNNFNRRSEVKFCHKILLSPQDWV